MAGGDGDGLVLSRECGQGVGQCCQWFEDGDELSGRWEWTGHDCNNEMEDSRYGG